MKTMNCLDTRLFASVLILKISKARQKRVTMLKKKMVLFYKQIMIAIIE